MVLDSLGAASDEPERGDEPSSRHGTMVRNQSLNRFEPLNDAD
jgi:hypothetical protein